MLYLTPLDILDLYENGIITRKEAREKFWHLADTPSAREIRHAYDLGIYTLNETRANLGYSPATVPAELIPQKPDVGPGAHH